MCNPQRLPFSQKRQVVVEETENEDPDASGGSLLQFLLDGTK